MTMIARGFLEKPRSEILAISEKDLENKTMTFRLSENDINRYNQHFVDTYNEMQREIASFSEVHKEHKEIVKGLKEKLDSLLLAAKKGEEERTVQCYKVHDYQNRNVEYYIEDEEREDVFVRIFVRSMSAAERQLKMNIHKINEAM